MKILFIVPYYKPAYIYGGPVVVVSMLAELLIAMDHDVSVYTTTANGSADLQVRSNIEVLVNGVKVTYFKKITADNTFISKDLWKAVHKNASSFDVVHIHTWWNFLVLVSAFICKRKGIKPVISPHGMFSNYILNKSNALIKNWIQILIGKNLLKNSWLHVSSQMEWTESQKMFQGWEGKVIPNLVKLADRKYNHIENQEFTIGFLSRIDPKKGLDLLIKALSGVNFPYKLLIAGSGQDQYIEGLKKLSVECGNDTNIEWVGWKNGDDKFEFLTGLDLFALISHSENFAIVIIESLSVGTPVLISDQIGLYTYVEERDFGWVTDLSIANITKQLNYIYLNRDERKAISTKAAKEIREDYEELNIARQYIELYNSTLVYK